MYWDNTTKGHKEKEKLFFLFFVVRSLISRSGEQVINVHRQLFTVIKFTNQKKDILFK